MDSLVGPIIAIVFIVLLVNFVLLMVRLRKQPLRKPGKKALEEKDAVVIRDDKMLRRQELEDEDTARHAELRNKTLDLYEEVRKRHAIEDNANSGQ